MAADANYIEAQHWIDRAAKGAKSESTHLDMVALVGVGYAILALMDEVIELRKHLATLDE
jgi:hypothetical protein